MLTWREVVVGIIDSCCCLDVVNIGFEIIFALFLYSSLVFHFMTLLP